MELIVHRPLPKNAVIKTVTISMDTDGCMYASISYEYDCERNLDIHSAVVANDKTFLNQLTHIGLDYSQTHFYVDSNGKTANYPHYYRIAEEKLASLREKLSKKVFNSHAYKKLKARIRKEEKHIANQRKDFTNKLAHKLTKEYDYVSVEDINLQAMGSCLSLGKNLHDNGFGMFRTQLGHKLRAKGSMLIKVDKWFPSSKKCHCCTW